MRRLFLILALFQFTVVIALSSPSLAQEWELRVKPRGILRVVDLFDPSPSAVMNCAEGLVGLDKDNNYVPLLAEDWRWIDERTLDFKLREGVRFHNGERFNAEAVRVNWEQYRKMKSPRVISSTMLPDETLFEIIDDYTVRFAFPEPDGLVFVKFLMFFQIAPTFFEEHKFDEQQWGYLPEPGPWGTGPFKLVEGSVPYGKPSNQVVLEANEDYWDSRYPMVQRVIFNNKLIGNRDEAMRLCREEEGAVDIVVFLRPLDTLKVAESLFAKVVKSNDHIVLYGVINQREKDSQWRDIRLRKALNYAVNREELWKYCARGNAYNLGGFIPEGVYGHSPDLRLYTYDTERARSLLAEAGYPKGFELKIITYEGWKLEAQIISKMLERIGLNTEVSIYTYHEFLRKIYVPILDRPAKEQDWDIAIYYLHNCYSHPAESFLSFILLEESDCRWIEYDSVYEEMWKDMARTVNSEAQEEKVRGMVKYIYDRAYLLFIYSPLTLYAVNKEVNFVPWKRTHLLLKEISLTDNHWSIRGENQ